MRYLPGWALHYSRFTIRISRSPWSAASGSCGDGVVLERGQDCLPFCAASIVVAMGVKRVVHSKCTVRGGQFLLLTLGLHRLPVRVLEASPGHGRALLDGAPDPDREAKGASGGER